MISRYTRPEMGRIWEDEARYGRWLDVELAACEAWAELGRIPKTSLQNIKRKAAFDVKRIDKIEAKVKHDVIAFLTSVNEKVGRDGRFIHLGLTSSDIVDTALSLGMRDAADIIIGDIKELMKVMKRQASKYRRTPLMGRSHGVHAEPTTFGLKFALWYEEMKRHLERVRRARETINVGTLSGAVGTFSNIPPALENKVLRKLKLKPEPLATQVVQRDRHAEFLGVLALVAAGVERVAVEIRHLQRTEVREAEEPFSKGQKGSSAMPHKRNPVGCENLSGLARVVRSNAMAALENVALWHERDISHSSVERVIIPDSCILVDYMLARLTGILSGLHVYPKRMLENMSLSRNLHCSQKVLLALVEKGLSREDAYLITQRNAMDSWRMGVDFKVRLLEDPEVTKRLTRADMDSIFDLKPYLENVDFLFRRVFGGKGGKRGT